VDAPLIPTPGAPPARRDPYAAARAWAQRNLGPLITGELGRLVWLRLGGDPATSGYLAARVHGWTAQRKRASRTYTIRGMIGAYDAFNLRQRPIYFVANPLGRDGRPRAWAWQIQEFEIHASTLAATGLYAPAPRSRARTR
jgi:hypothetical protein